MTTEADAIVVLGDFGAWEHTAAGVQFMNEVDRLGWESGVPLYWLHGNHDKHSHTVNNYSETNSGGFLMVRERVFYIPQGHAWTWEGVGFRSFGGAYSVDKVWRVQREQENYLKQMRKDKFHRPGPPKITASTEGTLWFPEEEMTDADMDVLLAADSAPKQVVLSHDKPLSSKPGWNRKDIAGCVPNQTRLDRALRAHQPDYWLHGHLHYHYIDQVAQTTVIGLEPDDNAREPGWHRAHTWLIADLADTKITITLGKKMKLDTELMQNAMMTLG